MSCTLANQDREKSFSCHSSVESNSGVRGVQLPAGGPPVRQGGQLLHHHHLPPHSDDRHRVLVLILD